MFYKFLQICLQFFYKFTKCLKFYSVCVVLQIFLHIFTIFFFYKFTNSMKFYSVCLVLQIKIFHPQANDRRRFSKKFRKATNSFPHGTTRLPREGLSMRVDIRWFSENPSRKIHVSSKSDKNDWYVLYK